MNISQALKIWLDFITIVSQTLNRALNHIFPILTLP